MDRLCRDCRFVEVSGEVARCLHIKATHRITDYYDGTTRDISPTISVARMVGACGEDGKLWEPVP